MSRVHVIAVITAKPGKRDELLGLFKANVPNVLAEDGCIEYGPVVDAEGIGFATPLGPDSYFVIEKWESLDHLKAHAAAPHMKDYAAKSKDLIADRKVHVMSDA